MEAEGVSEGGRRLSNLRYAHDTGIMAESKKPQNISEQNEWKRKLLLNENECKENENGGSEQKRSDNQNHASLAESLPAYQDCSRGQYMTMDRPGIRWRQMITELSGVESHGIQFDVLSWSPLMMMSY